MPVNQVQGASGEAQSLIGVDGAEVVVQAGRGDTKHVISGRKRASADDDEIVCAHSQAAEVVEVQRDGRGDVGCAGEIEDVIHRRRIEVKAE